MLLAIDLGNTFVKYAVFEDVELIVKEVCLHENAENIFLELLKNFPKISNCIYSGVGKAEEVLINLWKSKLNCTIITSETSIPFVNLYETPKTLGIDRLVLASGAALMHQNQNVLIIDAGTCITYDLVNENNEYLGGAISAGIKMRYKALNEFTAKLPKLDKVDKVFEIGKNTQQSIHFGVINGVIYEIEGFISKFSVKNTNLKIILTGGDTNFLANRLKSTIFADENFLLKSLQQLYSYLNKND